MNELIEHHVKYKELHGVDETIMLSRSEHKKLHMRLRREGKCNVPADELAKISTSAASRTKKWREYDKNIRKRKEFHRSVGRNVTLIEKVTYNLACGTVHCSTRFRSVHKQLPVIDIGGTKIE